jgi:hypothetical protein
MSTWKCDLGNGEFDHDWDEEIQECLAKPVKLSPEDEAALKQARPELLRELREYLRPDARRFA